MEDLTVVVGRDGVVGDATDGAVRRLGARPGRRCADIVGVRSAGSASPCRAGCTATLLEGTTPAVSLGTVRGWPCRVTCTPLGSSVVVRIEGLEGLPGEVSRPSPREQEVLTCIAEGLTTERIAARLGVSFATARTHVERLRARLGARTRAEAVAVATRCGWLPG